MGLFSRFFGSPEERQAKQILRDVEARHQPISQLGKAIIQAAFACEGALRPLVAGADEKERTSQWIEASFELVYFFLHMASVMAYGMLGPAKGKTLCNKLAELIPPSCVNGFFGHWPTERKEKILSEFFENLNSAEQEYTECRKLYDAPSDLMRVLLPEADPLFKPAKFSKLAQNLTNHLGRNGDVETMMKVSKLSMEAYTRMGLEELVSRAGAVL